MAEPIRVLFLEDTESDFLLIERHLKQHLPEAVCQRVTHSAELERRLTAPFDIVLSDYHVPGTTLESTLELVARTQPTLPVILVSGALGEEKAVDLLKLGLSDYVLKDNLRAWCRRSPAVCAMQSNCAAG
jgi:two-component system, sensor histidine kinase and response regulator